MTNSIDLEGIQITRTELQSLSSQWSLLISGIDYPSQKIASQLLESVALVYLRGRGCKMGNKQSRDLHKSKLYALIDAIYSFSTYSEKAGAGIKSSVDLNTTWSKLESGRTS